MKAAFPEMEHPPATERAKDVSIIAEVGPADGKPRVAPLRVRDELKKLGF